MLKKLIVIMALSWVASANATVLTFDDLSGDSSAIANGYGGFNWNSGTQVGHIRKDYHPGSGYDLGTVSPNNTAFNYFGASPTKIDLAGSGTFDFNGAYFTAAWDSTQNLTFEGWNNGAQLFTSSPIAINNQSPLWIGLNWLGIDRLVIRNSGQHWAMDNFTFNAAPNPVPLPAAAPLLLSGLGLLGFAARRRKAQLAA